MTETIEFVNQYYRCRYDEANHCWHVTPRTEGHPTKLAGPTDRIVIKPDANKSLTPL